MAGVGDSQKMCVVPCGYTWKVGVNNSVRGGEAILFLPLRLSWGLTTVLEVRVCALRHQRPT